MDDEFDLGGRLRALRQEAGLSQRALARRAGVSNAIISMIEQNQTSPSVGLLKRILAGLPLVAGARRQFGTARARWRPEPRLHGSASVYVVPGTPSGSWY